MIRRLDWHTLAVGFAVAASVGMVALWAATALFLALTPA